MDKHDYLRRYIEATRDVRGGFDGSRPRGEHPIGRTAYVDLFAGSGRARVRETRQFIDGSPLVALKTARNPFTVVILCELNETNAEALRRRTAVRRPTV
jgi:three-Cys-motif partner protein